MELYNMKIKLSVQLMFVIFISNFNIHPVESTYYCSSTNDPCTIAGALFEPYARTQNCPYDGTQQHVPCDRYKTPGWYRSDDLILDQCPTLSSCGAIYPVWFNGSLPQVADGVVSKKLCKTGFSHCCAKEYDVQIKNCGTFYVYCLPALDACPERFCFGTNGTCEYPTTTTTTTTTLPTTVLTTQTTTNEENVPSKEYKDLKKRYVVVIVLVVVLIICLVLLGSLITFIYIRKRMREREISQSRVELVPEAWSHDTSHTATENSNGVPPHLHFQTR